MALGVLGWLPHGQKYALLFGAWVAITELIPYLGPWLGAIPPLLYALVVEPGLRDLGRCCCSSRSTRWRATSWSRR